MAKDHATTLEHVPGGVAGRWAKGFVGTFGLWLLLTGTLALPEVVTGLVVAALVATLSLPYLGLLDGLRTTPGAALAALRFLGVFLVALVRANVDMARRVLTPRLPIDPELVEVRTALRSPLGRLLLANAITLTPGTLTVDVIDARVLVHWVDGGARRDLDAATDAIVAGFERHLLGFLH